MTEPDDGQDRARPALWERLLAGVLVAAVLIALAVVGYDYLKPKTEGACDFPTASGRTAVKQRGDGRRQVKAVVTLPEEADLSFDLGRDALSGVRAIPFSASKAVSGKRTLRVSASVFAQVGDGRPLDQGAVQVRATLDRSGRSGTAFVCMDPTSRTNGPWGAFSGTVVVEDPRFRPATIPVTLTASYPNVQNVALVGLLVCLLASIYVYFLREGSLKEQPGADDGVLRARFGFLTRYLHYTSGIVGALTLAAGLLGALTAFTAQYLTADVWAGDITEWLTFCGAVATAFVAGGTAGRLAGNRYAPDASRTDEEKDREKDKETGA